MALASCFCVVTSCGSTYTIKTGLVRQGAVFYLEHGYLPWGMGHFRYSKRPCDCRSCTQCDTELIEQCQQPIGVNNGSISQPPGEVQEHALQDMDVVTHLSCGRLNCKEGGLH